MAFMQYDPLFTEHPDYCIRSCETPGEESTGVGKRFRRPDIDKGPTRLPHAKPSIETERKNLAFQRDAPALGNGLDERSRNDVHAGINETRSIAAYGWILLSKAPYEPLLVELDRTKTTHIVHSRHHHGIRCTVPPVSLDESMKLHMAVRIPIHHQEPVGVGNLLRGEIQRSASSERHSLLGIGQPKGAIVGAKRLSDLFSFVASGEHNFFYSAALELIEQPG